MTNSRRRTTREVARAGFTLLELMVVLIILSLLGMIALPRFFDRVDDAKVTAARVQIQNMETALRLFYLDNGFYPTTNQGLQALVEKPADARNWREGGYLEKNLVPRDPWGGDYIYRSPGQGPMAFEIISLGRDGREGGTGVDADINNWQTEA
jgi:general secretion pathway protein G